MSNFPTGTSLSIGDFTFPDPDNLITLFAKTAGNVTTNCTFFTSDGTPYQVPSGKSLFVKCGIVLETQPNNTGVASILYSDNNVGFLSSSAFTNPKYVGGDVAAFHISLNYVALAAPFPFSIDAKGFQVPTGKYVGVYNNGSGSGVTNYQLFGYEK